MSKERGRERLRDKFNIRRGPLSKAAAIFFSAVALSGCGIGKEKAAPRITNQIPPGYVVPEAKVETYAENVARRLIELAKDRNVSISSIGPSPSFVGSSSSFILPLSENSHRIKFYDPNVPMVRVNMLADGKLKNGASDPDKVYDVGFIIDDGRDKYNRSTDKYNGYSFHASEWSGDWQITGQYYPKWDVSYDGVSYIAGTDRAPRPGEPSYGDRLSKTVLPLTEPALNELTGETNQILAHLEQVVKHP